MLDLDHVRAEVTEDLTDQGSGEDGGAVEDPDSGERTSSYVLDPYGASPFTASSHAFPLARAIVPP
jgi:hypothetical protein